MLTRLTQDEIMQGVQMYLQSIGFTVNSDSRGIYQYKAGFNKQEQKIFVELEVKKKP